MRMPRKRQNCHEIDTFSRRRLALFPSPSRGPSRFALVTSHSRFALALFVSAKIEAPEEEAGFNKYRDSST